jgi:glutaredoxin-like protein NrdH
VTVTVYTKPACPQCVATKRHLTKLGIEIDERPIDEAVLLRAEAAGIMSAPVVEAIGFPPFGGYRPDRLDALVA